VTWNEINRTAIHDFVHAGHLYMPVPVFVMYCFYYFFMESTSWKLANLHRLLALSWTVLKIYVFE